MKSVIVWIVIFAVVLTAGALAIRARVLDVLPMTGGVDATQITANELAALALRSTQYLQSLTTAIFGGALLVLTQQLLGRLRVREDSYRRGAIALGFLVLALSLATGFVTIEVVVEAADNGVVAEKMAGMRDLRVLQSGFLLTGVTLIGATLLLDIIRGSGEVST